MALGSRGACGTQVQEQHDETVTTAISTHGLLATGQVN